MCVCVCVCVLVPKWCPTLCHPTSLSVDGIFQARSWSWLPFPSSRNLPYPKEDQPMTPVSPALQADSFTAESLRKPILDGSKPIIRVFQLYPKKARST